MVQLRRLAKLELSILPGGMTSNERQQLIDGLLGIASDIERGIRDYTGRIEILFNPEAASHVRALDGKSEQRDERAGRVPELRVTPAVSNAVHEALRTGEMDEKDASGRGGAGSG